MRVALIVEYLDTWRGGAETSTQQFMHQLLDLGVELEVVTRSHVTARPGMQIHTLPCPGLSRSARAHAFYRRAGAKARSLDCNLVHSFVPAEGIDIYQPRGGTVAETMARNLALRPPGAARLLKRAAMGLNRKQQGSLRLERRMLTRPTLPLVLALSDYVIEQLQTHYGLSRDRIVKVYNGVDMPEADAATRAANRVHVRQTHGIDPGTLLVALVAHNFRLKGIATWLEALALLVREGAPVRSLVFGRDRSAAWSHRVRRLGVEGHVDFVGASQRMPAVYDAVDGLVHPTYYDPCSRVVLEALSSGVPVVTTRFDGAHEMVRDGVNGFVLEDPGDPAALAACIRRMRDDAFRATLAAGAAAVAPQISMRRHAEAVLQVYEAWRRAPAARRRRPDAQPDIRPGGRDGCGLFGRR